MNNQKEKILLSIKRSRKAFLTEYTCAGFLFIMLWIQNFNGIQLRPILTYFVMGVASLAVVSAEASRFIKKRYKITNKKMIITEGLIKEKTKNVHFHPLGFVPDINVKQSRLQKILNYGTIYVKGGSENAFEIEDVNKPRKILKIIEDLVEKNRIIDTKTQSGLKKEGAPI